MPKRVNFLDSTEDPYFIVRASDNVYSYFMFISPTDTKREGGKMTWDIIMAYILIALNFAMQGTLLYVIFNDVVGGNQEWQDGIMSVGGNDWGLFSKEKGDTCNDGGSLCFADASGNFTCAPPTIQIAQRWDELDTDGDGVWTLEEVQQAKDDLQCKYVVNPVEVFTVFQTVLLSHQDKIWLHPDVIAGKAIHKPYFDFAMGDVIMCSYRNQDMCPNLVKRGYFHAPLKYGTSPRVGTTIDTALKYCRNLLKDGGFCEMNLPSTYRTWKIESGQQCGSPSYDKFTYTNPGNGAIKSLLSVDYEARQAYELSKTNQFRAFKAVVLFLWLVGMLVEFREVTMVLTWVMRFPDAEQFGEEAVIEEQDPADPEDVRYRIQGITHTHRMGVGFLLSLRGFMAAILTFVGMNFLLKQTDYIDLLLDGVALIFIVEIQQILYAQILREEIRDQCEDIFPMHAEMYGVDYLNRRPALTDMVSLAALFACVYVIENWHKTTIVVPIHDALQCTCLSSGPNCYEAQKFGYDFWHNYWKQVVPSVFTAISALKSGDAPEGAVAFGAKGAAHAVHPSALFAKPDLAPSKSLLGKMARVGPKDAFVHKLHHHHHTQSKISSWLHHFKSFLR